ncbi:hypothetical protein C4D60_Mb08t14400 [Musa balbisiana]|uniref:RRM domain-containing protein n=1 Tax=Musa balbisiana TaxID=52838 RepID=A0A4S8K3Q3_MUSBA|nr:hypothetical protein C4D60_Mb08t14400 [Musa balbisiana]
MPLPPTVNKGGSSNPSSRPRRSDDLSGLCRFSSALEKTSPIENPNLVADPFLASPPPPPESISLLPPTTEMMESAPQFAYQALAYFPGPFHLQNAYQALAYFPGPFHLQNAYLTVPQVTTTSVPAAAYSLPQHQQAQQLFQKDAQIITREALTTVKAAIASSTIEQKLETKKKAIPRKAAGKSWEDPMLADWPENDFRLFCGDLGNEVNDDILSKAFSKYPSFNMARVVRDKWTGKTKGYGFVSFANASDLTAAMKEMNGKYVGNRPIKLRKSTWKDRIDYEALGKRKNHVEKKPKLPKGGILLKK